MGDSDIDGFALVPLQAALSLARPAAAVVSLHLNTSSVTRGIEREDEDVGMGENPEDKAERGGQDTLRVHCV